MDSSSDAFLLRQVAEQAQQFYFILEVATNRFTYFNPAFLQFWNLPQEVLEQQPDKLLTFLHPEDRVFVKEEYRLSLEQQKPRKIEFRVVFPGEQTRWLCVSTFPLLTENGFCLAGYADDITTAKVYQEDLLKHNTKINSILQILAHDLAHPLANIEAITDILEEQLKAGDLDVKGLIDFIKLDAKTGSNLIRDFVHNEFLESSQVKINPKRVDIVAKLETLIDNYKKGVKLIPKQFKFIPCQRPVYACLDENKFMQVLNNLISNAIKFTPDQGLITLTLEEKEKDLLITIADNGVGIPKKHQPVLFDKFTKARRPGLRGERSVGLGMSIIKKIMELHQGQIWFESQENKGTIFYLQIPKTEDCDF